MTVTQLKESGWLIYECIAGSRAYGLNTSTSDTDIRGVYIQPTKEILAGRYIPQISSKSNDEVYFEVQFFIELAAKGNPNILDLLNTPQDCILFKDPLFDAYFPDPQIYLTKKLKDSFVGYAHAQIKKAKGLGKKISWDKENMKRKTVLDFCYVLVGKESSVRFLKWSETNYHSKDIGLSCVNNFPGVYSMYYMFGKGGICDCESNDVQLKSIPTSARHIGYLRFDREAYSAHCKNFREYEEWKLKRNPERYKNNVKNGGEVDYKNMMHCMRLLLTSADIAKGLGLNIRRPEREYLLGIRNGEVSYEELLGEVDNIIGEIKINFDKSNLPNQVSITFTQELLLQIRLNNIKHVT